MNNGLLGGIVAAIAASSDIFIFLSTSLAASTAMIHARCPAASSASSPVRVPQPLQLAPSLLLLLLPPDEVAAPLLLEPLLAAALWLLLLLQAGGGIIAVAAAARRGTITATGNAAVATAAAGSRTVAAAIATGGGGIVAAATAGGGINIAVVAAGRGGITAAATAAAAAAVGGGSTATVVPGRSQQGVVALVGIARVGSRSGVIAARVVVVVIGGHMRAAGLVCDVAIGRRVAAAAFINSIVACSWPTRCITGSAALGRGLQARLSRACTLGLLSCLLVLPGSLSLGGIKLAWKQWPPLATGLRFF